MLNEGVIHGAVKAVEVSASVGTRDMLLRASKPRSKGEKGKGTSAGAETGDKADGDIK